MNLRSDAMENEYVEKQLENILSQAKDGEFMVDGNGGEVWVNYTTEYKVESSNQEAVEKILQHFLRLDCVYTDEANDKSGNDLRFLRPEVKELISKLTGKNKKTKE